MDDTNTPTGNGPESGGQGKEHGSAGRCGRSRRRGLKTFHLVLLGAAIAAGTALLVTGLRAADDEAAAALAPAAARETLALEGARRRVEGLQRRDVPRPGAFDRRAGDEWVQLTHPRLDLGQLGHALSVVPPGAR